MLSHHKLGRHSVASQAVTSGEAVKVQLGHKSEQSTHKYAHLGSGAQRRLMEGLEPAAAAPHELATRTATTSVHEASTEAAQATSAEAHVNQA